MRPRPFDVVSLVSLLACATVTVLCVRSPAGGDRIDVNLFRVRHTFVCHHGRVVIAAPARGTPAAEARAWELVAALRNDDIAWVHNRPAPRVSWCGTGLNFREFTPVRPVPREGSPAAQLLGMPGADVGRPLLAALDDPNRATAAHVLLCSAHTPVPLDLHEYYATGAVAYDGMHVLLVPPAAGPPTLCRDGSSDTTYTGPDSWQVDPSELPALRQRWYERLAGPVGSFSLFPPIAALAVAPAVWLWFTLTRLAGEKPTPPGFVPVDWPREQEHAQDA